MPWVGTWTTSPAPVLEESLDAQTLRMTMRTSLAGRRVRVRLSNAFGLKPVRIGAARIALRAGGPVIRPETCRVLRFSGEPAATIPAGAHLISDPVELHLPDLADVAVSVHLVQPLTESFGITGHGNARQTSYLSPPGDHTAATEMPVAREVQSWFVVSGIEVEAPASTRGLVAFGDSLTDANVSTVDACNRWPDQLARRLVAKHGRCTVGVMNQGLGGNRLLHDQRGDSGLKRFDRDVLAQPGVTDVVMLLGVNDLRNRRGDPDEDVSAAQMIAGYRQIALRAKGHGLRMMAATLLPFEHETFNPGCWTPEREAIRQEINGWIRTGSAFDAVIDLDAALRDPTNPVRMRPELDCGDHLHPNDAGYRAMGDAIDLALVGG